MEAFSRAHEFIRAVGDLEGFRSVHKDQPPVLLLLHFILSRCCAHIAVTAFSFKHPLGSTLVCATPCLSPRSGNLSGVDGALRPSWLRTGGVTGADTGTFAAPPAALKSPCNCKYRILHCRVRCTPSSSHFGVHVQTTIAYHNTRASQHELPLVQACDELVLDHDSLLIPLSRSSSGCAAPVRTQTVANSAPGNSQSNTAPLALPRARHQSTA